VVVRRVAAEVTVVVDAADDAEAKVVVDVAVDAVKVRTEAVVVSRIVGVADGVQLRAEDVLFSPQENLSKALSKVCWRCIPRDMDSCETPKRTTRRKTLTRSFPVP